MKGELKMEIKIALAGNPNCGKTTLFNALTGSNQFVGNWPGVTVEKKEGRLKGSKDVIITDLPGIYSLSPYTLEEVVARNYLINERPDAIINIIDGTNLERNLYLTTQLSELGIPMIAAVNMMDVVEKNGDKININKLEKELGCEVVAISALKGSGIDEAADKAIEAAKSLSYPKIAYGFNQKIEEAITEISSKLTVDERMKRFYSIKLFENDEKIAENIKNLPDISDIRNKIETEFDDDAESIITNERYEYISKIINSCYVEKNKHQLSTSDKIDKIVTNRLLALPIFAVVMFIVYYISVSTVGTIATDWANDGVFGDGWYLFSIGRAAYEEAAAEFEIESLKTEAFLSSAEEEGLDTTTVREALEAEEIDEAEIRKFADEAAGINAELEITDEEVKKISVDSSSFVDAALAQEPESADFGVWIPGIPVFVEMALDALNCSDWLKSLVLDGIVGGVGAVLGFVPQMLVLFMFLAFLEACGYMARIAFIMDRIFRRFGLSGKSFIPMLIGTGCGVPGVMASRTIENESDRRMTIMTTTFIPCGAKLPIIALIAGAMFGGAWWVAPSAYFVGVAAIVVSGIMLKKTEMFAGDAAPFVMELPAYHMPTVGSVLRSMWERGWSFIKKAGTIILLSTILVWFGSSFGFVDGRFGMVEDLSQGILASIGRVICIIFAPLGFGDWKAAVAAVTGLIAKENVVGTFGILYGFAEVAEDGAEIWGSLSSSYTPIAAYSFLVFNLLCAPCFAAIGAIRREMNSAKWTWFAIGYQTIFAYVVSLIIYQFGSFITGGGFGIGTVAALILALLLIVKIFTPYNSNKFGRMKASAERG